MISAVIFTASSMHPGQLRSGPCSHPAPFNSQQMVEPFFCAEALDELPG